MRRFEIRRLGEDEGIVEALAELLVETVARGGSVSFMHPLSMADARKFWAGSLSAAMRGERILLGAFQATKLVATVSLLLDCPPNQPHRAEIAKMMTKVENRGQGAATALLLEAERAALGLGRTLLTLDTASDDGASRLYEAMGYHFTGEIPDYALKPHGGLTGTRIYWKRIVSPEAC